MSSEDRRYPNRPIVGVGAVILVGPNDPVYGLPTTLPSPYGVVLVKRRFEPLAGHWSLPGGALEVGETLEAGVAREILEETGLVVEVGVVIDVFDRIILDDVVAGVGSPSRLRAKRSGGTRRSQPEAARSGTQRVLHHYVLIDYLCRPTGGALAAASDVSDVSIVDPQALASYGVTSKVEDVVSRALELARE